jgi:hypothetical protein
MCSKRVRGFGAPLLKNISKNYKNFNKKYEWIAHVVLY